MLKKIKIYLGLVAANILLLSSATFAGDDPMMIRPHFGFGYTDIHATQENGQNTHVGLRLLLASNNFQRYGMEITKMNAYETKNIQYFATGIILEQKRQDGFLMAIGTIGYVGIGGNSKNPFGIVTNLGWEPNTAIKIKPFVTYRSDLIFEENRIALHSISLGFTF